MTAACLHQPNFVPWVKLMAKIVHSDVYVVYDSVQFTRTEFHNRQRLRARHGDVLLSVPVRGARRREPLCAVRLADETDWRGYHLRIIEQEYRRSPHFAEVFDLISAVYANRHGMLVDHNLDLLGALLRYLAVEVRVVRATTLAHTGDNTDRLIQLTRAVGADEHVTSTWGTDRRYIDWDRVRAAGIAVRTQQFTHPVYRQAFEPFVPDLGVLDLLFARGRRSVDDIRSSSTFPRVG